jgi:hypothetical protein
VIPLNNKILSHGEYSQCYSDKANKRN